MGGAGGWEESKEGTLGGVQENGGWEGMKGEVRLGLGGHSAREQLVQQGMWEGMWEGRGSRPCDLRSASGRGRAIGSGAQAAASCTQPSALKYVLLFPKRRTA